MKVIQTDQAPTPAGHYSQAIVHNGVVYISGQLPIDPNSGKPELGEVEDQVRLALRNLDAILLASGSSLQKVLRVTVYIDDVALWPRVNQTYAEVFGNWKPARTVVPSGKLHYGAHVEVDAIAVVD